jgi:hypothetical protein
MAQTLAGLLTGVPQNAIDPNLSIQQQQLALGASAADMMGSGIRSMTGQQSQGDRAAGLQMAMSNLDLNDTEDLTKLARIMQATGDTAGAGKIAALIQDKKLKGKQREGLIKQAKGLGLDQTVDMLTSGGDVETATKQILEAEERNIVSKQGRKGRARVAESKGAGKPVIDAILKGDYDNVSDALFLEELSGEKADLKFFQQTDSEGTVSSVPFPVNAAGQVRNPKTEKWVYPDELGLTQAPVTTKQLSEANSFTQALTEGAAKSFLELSRKAQDAKEILRTNAESLALLDRDGGIKTGFGAEFRLNVARVAKELGVVPESMDNIAATEQYLILRAEQLMKIMPAFGAGSGLSDSDREVASSIALREVSMDEAALRNLLRLEEKYARQTIIDNNKAVDRAIKIGKGGMSPELAESFYIALPKREGYKTPPAAATYLNQ